ncbi:MAG: S9 family peptidase [Phycisphaeraceae bacterium]|nr:S9 family peptidase [Phycisphaeraceae bacterium]
MKKAFVAIAGCAGVCVMACQALDPKPGGMSEASRAAASPNPITTDARPPATRVETVVNRLHGVDVRDDYQWLEGDNSDPAAMGKLTDEVATWTDAQNAYTRSVLDNLPGRRELEERLRPLMEVGSVSTPQMRGNRYFYSKREGTQNQAVVYMREGYNGESRALLDPAAIDASGLTTVSWYVPSHDGKLLAYGTYRSGDENSTLRLMAVDTGADSGLEIPGKVGGVTWLPDNSGFTYRNLWDVKNPYSGQVMFHKIGQEVSTDAQLFRQFTPEENKELATTYGPYGGLSDDGKWLVLAYYTDTRNNDLWVADFQQWQRTGRLERKAVAVGEKGSFSADVYKDKVYIFTTLDSPNGRIIVTDAANPGRENWKSLIPERPDSVIQGFSIADGVIAVDYLKNASSQIELFDLSGKTRGTLRLPGIGSAGLATAKDRTEAYLTFTSYNYPSSIFRVDLAKPEAEPDLWERPDVPVDPSSVVVKQEWYTSKDGTKVSMFIVHKKGLRLTGDNPTLLYGYGGFRISLTPTFSAPLFPWFEDGGVYVVANLRGGGEYGDAWHEDGRLARKQNVYDDFIAAGEHLIQRGYTNSQRLAVLGGSNGGLLTGVMVTQRPDLFQAAIVAVPLLDMLRYQSFLMARYWVPEYGSAENPEQFEFIRAYSPFHNIKSGTKYPAVLVTAGENDTRVHPLHARKFAAALQAATGSDISREPVLLWVDRDAGHGQGKPLNLRIRDAADMRIFLMWQLGMLKK